jgi:hypothetical protein
MDEKALIPAFDKMYIFKYENEINFGEFPLLNDSIVLGNMDKLLCLYF